MNCQIDALQIDPRYKQAMVQFCSIPDNEDVCRQICELPPEVLQEKLQAIEGQLQEWTENGVPPELEAAAQQLDPEVTRQAGEFMNNEAPQILAHEKQMRGAPSAPPVQGFADGGLATKGRLGDTQMAHVAPGEVVVPRGVFKDNPGLRQGLGQLMLQSGADPRYYTVGNERNRINPQTGLPEYGFLGKALGAVAGFALAGATGGMSLALGAGLGTAAGGMLIDGDNFGEAAKWGLGAYGIAGAGIGLGAWGAGTAGFGQGLGAFWTAPGSTAMGGMFSSATPAMEAACITAAGPGSQAAMLAEQGFAGTHGLAGGIEAASATTTGSSIPVINNAAGGPLGNTAGNTAAPSFLDKATKWVGDNKIQTALIGSTLLGAMEEPQLPREPTGAEYFNEYDAYTDCLAAGGSEASCQAAHPKGWAEIAPPPRSRWIAGAGDMTGEPGSAGNPIGGAPMEQQPWYQQMSEFGYAGGGEVRGPGTETSDSIPVNLSNNEFVLTADAVRGAGNGSVKRGARKLYDLMDKLERRAYNG